jgi:aminopeptidase N
MGRDTLDVPILPAPGDRTVAVTYHASPKGGVYFRGGKGTSDRIVEAWSQGENEENRYWYPGWDYPNDRFTVREAYTVPAGYEAIGNGALTARSTTEDGWTRFEYRLDSPISNYLVVMAAGQYRIDEDKSGPVPLAQVVPPWADAKTVARSTAETGPVLAFFADLLAKPYPYPVYRQVFVQRFLYGGMENASDTVADDAYLLDDPHLQGRAAEIVVAHEAAHQWFGDLIGCYGWRELWLNEGFASYYENRWLENAHGRDVAAGEVEGWMERGHRDRAPLAARGWSKVGDRRNSQVYARGAAVLHMLEVALGRDVFDAGIREYVRREAGGLAETDDLRRALEDVSGRSLGWLFDRFVFGSDFAKVKARSSWEEGKLKVELSSSDGPLPGGPVEIEIGTDDGPRRERVWLDAADVRLVIPLDKAPHYVAVDPDRGVLADWDLDQPPAEWIAQLQESKAILARRRAIAALGNGKAADGVVDALSKVLADGGEAAETRQAAAGALGKLGTAENVAPLVAALRATDGAVREAAVSALGKLVATPEASAAARRSLSDPDPDVRDSALRALATLDPKEGTAEARKLLTGRSTRWSAHAAAEGVLGDDGDATDIPRMIARIDPGETRSARHSAARAAADLIGREDSPDEYRPQLTKKLVAMLGDVDRLDSGVAIGLLAQQGDESAIPALTAFAAENTMLDPDLTRSALDAASAIRTRDRGAEKTPEQQADLKRLQDALDEVERRVDRLEEWR